MTTCRLQTGLGPTFLVDSFLVLIVVAEPLDPRRAKGHRYTLSHYISQLSQCIAIFPPRPAPQKLPYRSQRGGEGRGYRSSSCRLEGIAFLGCITVFCIANRSLMDHWVRITTRNRRLLVRFGWKGPKGDARKGDKEKHSENTLTIPWQRLKTPWWYPEFALFLDVQWISLHPLCGCQGIAPFQSFIWHMIHNRPGIHPARTSNYNLHLQRSIGVTERGGAFLRTSQHFLDHFEEESHSKHLLEPLKIAENLWELLRPLPLFLLPPLPLYETCSPCASTEACQRISCFFFCNEGIYLWSLAGTLRAWLFGAQDKGPNLNFYLRLFLKAYSCLKNSSTTSRWRAWFPCHRLNKSSKSQNWCN